LGFLKALLLFAGLANAQQQAPGALIGAPYRDFSGGYVDSISPSNLAPNQSPNLLNVKIDDPVGSLKPRDGYTRCGVTPSGLKPTIIYEYTSNSSGGTPRCIISDSSTAWQTQDCITFTTVTTRLAGGSLPSIATVRDKIWIVNKSTHVITWNGTAEGLLDGRAGTPSPAPPKFNYIEFWNERVWGARTSANPSGVYFSDLTDTLGNDLDPSTGSVSWPADNVIQIAQENGSPVYAIKVYRNSLYAFKDNGIWKIDFNGPFDITVSKTLSAAGTRYQQSVVEHDNLLYFVGRDGIYAFDGVNAVRVSDAFKNKFAEINQNNSNASSNIWDTQANFELGTASRTDTATEPGTVILSSATAVLADSEFESGSLGTWTCGSNLAITEPYGCTPKTGAQVLSGQYSARVYTSFGSSGDNLYVFSVAGSTLVTKVGCGDLLTGSTYYIDLSAYSGTSVRISFRADTVGGDWMGLYSPEFVANGRLTYQCDTTNGPYGGAGYNALDNFQQQSYLSSGTHTSEVFNAVSISSWSTFEAEATTNGGSIVYQVRVGTNTGAVAAASWTTITPGSLITGTSAQVYLQWRATLSASTDTLNTPSLDTVIINYLQGDGSSQSIYSYSRDGNLYISASTGAATTNNIVFVKSRAPLNSWTIYDWKIGPMATVNSRFYAGSSTGSFISRMNYGTNDGGYAIPWFWESRDDTFGQPNIRKYLMEINLDYVKGTETALTAGYSRNSGSSYTTKSVSASGSGRGTSRLFMAGSNSMDYRFRVSGSSLDGTVSLLGLTGWARPAVLRE